MLSLLRLAWVTSLSFDSYNILINASPLLSGSGFVESPRTRQRRSCTHRPVSYSATQQPAGWTCADKSLGVTTNLLTPRNYLLNRQPVRGATRFGQFVMKTLTLAIVLMLEIATAMVNKMAAIPYNPDADLNTVSRAARIKCNFRNIRVLGIIYQLNFITQINCNTEVIQGVPRGALAMSLCKSIPVGYVILRVWLWGFLSYLTWHHVVW